MSTMSRLSDPPSLADLHKPRFVTVLQAANMSGLSKATMYRKIRSGELESVRLGVSRRIPVERLLAWWEQSATVSTQS